MSVTRMTFRILLMWIILVLTGQASAGLGVYEIEPNDLTAAANDILPGAGKRGNSNALDDLDWYRVDTTAPATLRVTLEYPSDSYVYNLFWLSLYDADDTLLSKVSAYAPDGIASTRVGVGAPGAYFVLVETACESASGRCAYHRSDEYLLSVAIESNSSDVFETEPNDTHASADAFAGGTVIGHIATEDDVDVFALQVAEPSDISIAFTHPRDSYQYNLHHVQVRNAASDLINATDMYAPDDVTPFGFAAAAPGTYYLEVSGCESSSRCDIHRSDQYSLDVTLTPWSTLRRAVLNGALDIDGNGATDALTDGLLVLRHLFGFTGDTLISGAIGNSAGRTTAAAIESYLLEFTALSDSDSSSISGAVRAASASD